LIIILRVANSFADISLLLNEDCIGKATRTAKRDSKHIDIDDGVITEAHCVDTVRVSRGVRNTVHAKLKIRAEEKINVAEVFAGIGYVSSAPSSSDIEVSGPIILYS
jgi:hypothetical protein